MPATMTRNRKRTDVHRPSAINPAEYEWVCIECMKIEDIGDCHVIQEERKRLQAHMARTGGTYASHDHGGNCGCCGAHCIYTQLFYHAPTNSYVRFGNTCAVKMEMGDERAFRSFQNAIKDARNAKAGLRKAQALLEAAECSKAWELFQLHRNQQDPARCEELVVMGIMTKRTYTDPTSPCECLAAGEVPTDSTTNCPHCKGHGWVRKDREVVQYNLTRDMYILDDIVSKVVRYGDLSEGQAKFLKSLIEKITNAKAIQEQRAKEKESAEPCPTGRVDVKGIILKLENRQTDFGTCWKMTVKDDRGFVVWGTAPGGVNNRGDRVEFTCTLTPTPNDPKFGFFKRPYLIKCTECPEA